MATTNQPTTLVASLASQAEDARKTVLKAVHPLFQANEAAWATLLDAYEGAGGFADGSYLWKYRRETDVDYRERGENARYHNFAKPIVRTYVRYILGRGVKRTTDNADLVAWWANADGAGTPLDTIMARALTTALASGHEGLLVDKTPDAPTGPAKADERARPFIALYPPTTILDWRTERNAIVGLKLADAAPHVDILTAPPDGDAPERLLLWTTTEWARVDAETGDVVTAPGGQGVHGLGRVPFVVLNPDPSALHPEIGQSLIGDPNVHKALYNRCSEEDEVLRSQGFSTLVVSVANSDDVERVKQQFPSETGTGRAIVTSGTVSFETPDQGVPEAIRKNIAFLIQEIYRAANVRFQRDSLQAEAADAIRLQHSELEQMLLATAQECQRVEIELAKLYFAWMSATPEQAAAAFDAAKVIVEYPREFFVREMLTELETIANAIALELGDTFTKRLKKKTVRVMDPEIDDETAKKVDAEIDAQTATESAGGTTGSVADQLRQNMTARLGALSAGVDVPATGGVQ